MIVFSAKTLKRRSDLHLARKAWHCLGVLALLVFYTKVPRPLMLQGISFLTLFAVAADLVRQRVPKVNQCLMFVFHPFMREHERDQFAGTSYLLVGVLVVVALFPPSIVILTLLFLALADPIASLVGILYGRDKIMGHKSLQGSFAAFVTCALVAAVYFHVHGAMTERFIIVSLIAGLIGAFAELIPIGNVDDNFTFPVVSSSLLFGLFWIFGGF